MNTSNMKNIVVLRDLPSNIVEEAIVVLKQNQKLKKVELVDADKNKSKIENKKVNKKDYIINEAQMLISEYITKIENRNKGEDKKVKDLKKKYFKLKIINVGLFCALVMSFFMYII